MSETNNLPTILQAVNKLKDTVQPTDKEGATIFWTTQQFIDAIEQITGCIFTRSEITTVLKQDFYEEDFIQGIGMVWWVRIVE